jgi:hypothetical protein
MPGRRDSNAEAATRHLLGFPSLDSESNPGAVSLSRSRRRHGAFLIWRPLPIADPAESGGCGSDPRWRVRPAGRVKAPMPAGARAQHVEEANPHDRAPADKTNGSEARGTDREQGDRPVLGVTRGSPARSASSEARPSLRVGDKQRLPSTPPDAEGPLHSAPLGPATGCALAGFTVRATPMRPGSS